MARSRVQLPRNAQLGRLRQQIETTALGPIEITRPLPQEIETAALGVPTPGSPTSGPSPIPQPPPGGWPEDAGWREEAEHRQGLMGEDAQ